MSRNLPMTVRSARLSSATKAFTLLHADLPADVRRTLNNHAGAIKMLVAVDEVALARDACDAMTAVIKELADEAPSAWVERLAAITESVKLAP